MTTGPVERIDARSTPVALTVAERESAGSGRFACDARARALDGTVRSRIEARWRRASIGAGVCFGVTLSIVMAGATVGGWFGEARTPVEEPAAWALWGPPHVVSPGALGCASTAGETCLSLSFRTLEVQERLSSIGFELEQPPWNATSVINSTHVPLGPAAMVTVLARGGSAVGVWNWTSADWTTGAGWLIPSGPNLTLVFDTGSVELNVTGDMFWLYSVPTTYYGVGTELAGGN